MPSGDKTSMQLLQEFLHSDTNMESNIAEKAPGAVTQLTARL
jgi:hypothetical protein